MATFGQRFKALRSERKLTQDKLAKIFFTKKSSISRYENNLQVPEIESLQKYADFFNVSIDYLLGRSDFRKEVPKDDYIPEKTVRVPIIGVVRAGEPLYAEQNILGYFTTDIDLLPAGECFYLKVIGDSMNLSHIVDGQLILISRQDEVENGEMALVLVDGEDATIKKFYRTDTTVTLMPNSSNPVHQPRVIDIRNTSVKAIGKVMGTYINFER